MKFSYSTYSEISARFVRCCAFRYQIFETKSERTSQTNNMHFTWKEKWYFAWLVIVCKSIVSLESTCLATPITLLLKILLIPIMWLHNTWMKCSFWQKGTDGIQDHFAFCNHNSTTMILRLKYFKIYGMKDRAHSKHHITWACHSDTWRNVYKLTPLA